MPGKNGDKPIDINYEIEFTDDNNIKNHSTSLQTRMKKYVTKDDPEKYKVIENVGKGDCFFLAFLDSYDNVNLTNKEEKLTQLRKWLSFEINKNNDRYNYLLDIKNNKSGYGVTEPEYQWLFENEEINFMDNINNFKGFIRTAHYWATHQDIGIIENKFKVKIIIFDINKQNEIEIIVIPNDYTNNEDNEDNVKYIMLQFEGYHYKLITYNGIKQFLFSDIPYEIKELVAKYIKKNGYKYFTSDFNTYINKQASTRK